MKALNGMIRWSLSNRWLVFMCSVLLVAAGIRSAFVLPVDVFPDFSPTKVDIVTEAPGYAPLEVEALVTRPLEQALGGTARAKTIRSISAVGLSVITVIFEDGTDVFVARQLVQERIQTARGELAGGTDPQLAPIATITGDILKAGFVIRGDTTPMELRTLADWTVRPRLMAIPGVSNVVTYGGEVKQYQILVDPLKLAGYNLTLDEVVASAAKSNAASSGGTLRTDDSELLIRGLGRVKDSGDIARHVITIRDGTPITIAQVATVIVGPAFQTADAVIDGKPALIMNVVKQPWANTLTTTYNVEKAISELKAAMPSDVEYVTVFRQADFIETAIYNVEEALAAGGILVAIVLVLFLKNWRTALVSLTAIPLSLLTAVITIEWMGETINTMTLAGLALAIGEVVDDAIIDVENVHRRLREYHARTGIGSRTGGRVGGLTGAVKVIYDASVEIRSSVVYASFIVCLVFLPVFALSGLEGKIFAPLAISYIVAIMASLVVALTVVPAMCYLLLSGSSHAVKHDTNLVVWLKRGYVELVGSVLKRPRLTVGVSIAVFLISLTPLAFVGTEFLPEFDESNLVVSVTSIPGTSLSLTARTGRVLTGHLASEEHVLAAGQRSGRAEGSDDYVSSNSSEVDVRLSEAGKNKAEQLKHVRDDFAAVPGAIVNVGSYIRHRMDHSLSGVNAAIAIKLFGAELPVLHEKARLIEALIKQVPGIVDAQLEPIVPVPDISIEIDRDAAARYGMTVGDLVRIVESAFRGTSVSKVLEGQRTFDLFVWFDPRYRSDLESIARTLVDTPSGARVPISSLAVIKPGESANAIRHEMLSRLVVVQANVSGRDLGSVIAQVRAEISRKVSLPPGYYVVYGGQFEAQEEATSKLLFLSVISCAGIFALLCLAFSSGSIAALVMSNLPMALVGAVWAVVLSGGVLSVGSLLGFITLFGLSTRNGIIMVSHMRDLYVSGAQGSSTTGQPSDFNEIIKQGALDRLVPVLMTALTAALGVLPVAIMGGAGREIEQPLATVILGGMLSSTALTLLVIPALLKLLGEKRVSNQTT